MSDWIHIEKPLGATENHSVLKPMPKGPYLLMSQFDEKLEGVDKENVDGAVKWVDDLPNYFCGSVAYAVVDGKLKQCVRWYDTSD